MVIGPRSKLLRLDRAYRLALRDHRHIFDRLIAAHSVIGAAAQYQFLQDYLESLDNLVRTVSQLHRYSQRAGDRQSRSLRH